MEKIFTPHLPPENLGNSTIIWDEEVKFNTRDINKYVTGPTTDLRTYKCQQVSASISVQPKLRK